MSVFRSVCLLAAAALVAACGGAPPTAAPTSAPTTAPTSAPTAVPSLDPSQSDAGVVGRATVSGDGRAERDGTYDIIGTAADASSCETSFSGDEFLVSAVDEAALNGQIRSMFVNVSTEVIPDADGGRSAGITEGRAGFDFKSDSFVGTLYVGDPQDDDRTSVTIEVLRAGTDLTFNFSGTTWDGVAISGQVICADAV